MQCNITPLHKHDHRRFTGKSEKHLKSKLKHPKTINPFTQINQSITFTVASSTQFPHSVTRRKPSNPSPSPSNSVKPTNSQCRVNSKIRLILPLMAVGFFAIVIFFFLPLYSNSYASSVSIDSVSDAAQVCDFIF